jgi:hypothetical protein
MIFVTLINLLIAIPIIIKRLKRTGSFKETLGYVQKIVLINSFVVYIIFAVLLGFVFANIFIILTYPLLVTSISIEVIIFEKFMMV